MEDKMNKILILFISSIFCIILSCSDPVSTGDGAPMAPPWVEITAVVDSIPSVGQTGGVHFQIIVVGKNGSLPLLTDKDTVNHINVSFLNESKTRKTIISGDTAWSGVVSIDDTISLNTQFTPIKTSFVYCTFEGGYREFDWMIELIISYRILYDNGTFNTPNIGAPPSALLYVNTITGDTFLDIKTNNRKHLE